VKVIRHLDEADLQGGALSIGNFDGVHRGHARLVEKLRALAGELGGPAVILTFDPHPVRLLRPDAAPPPLTWTERKAELLGTLGIDAMIAYPTDERLLALSPAEFFHQIVCDKLAARAMVEGPNFFFGRGRAGDVRLLSELCAGRGIALSIVEPETMGSEFVSSSRVRAAIAAGDVGLARRMLTQPYRVRGLVTHGAARGARIGFPTANIEAVDTLLPGRGVYAGRAFLGDARWPAAINLGPSPTFGEQTVKVEAHLIGFTGSLYGRPLEVDFLERLRDIRPFASLDELTSQLHRDVAAALQLARDSDAAGRDYASG
jgi:riboflavin kinase/FMN adenylyltransferase